MDSVDFKYRLPVTRVTISGKRSRVSNPHTVPSESTTRTSAFGIEITADTRDWYTVSVDHEQFEHRKFEVTLLPDGRLSAVNSKLEDKSGDRVQAALKVGAAAAGALTPVLAGLGPVGLAAAAITGVAIGGITWSGLNTRTLASSLPGGNADRKEPAARPPLEELGVPSAYKAARPAEAEVLGNLRWSEMCLVARLAGWTDPDATRAPLELAASLRALQKSLGIVRMGLLEAERAYGEWLAQHTVTTVDDYNESFFLDELPDSSALQAEAAKGFPFDGPRWGRLFEDLRFAVSCDLLDPDPTETSSPPPQARRDDDDVLWHRKPRMAKITHWRVEKRDDGRFDLKESLVERKVVVLRGDEVSMGLVSEESNGEVSVTFDSEGLLATYGLDLTGRAVERAQAVSGLPGALKDAFAAGNEIGAPLAATSQASELKAQVELLEARAKLDKARGGPPPPDRLQTIREELEEAELQARLSRARAIVSEPTRSLVEVTIRESPVPED